MGWAVSKSTGSIFHADRLAVADWLGQTNPGTPMGLEDRPDQNRDNDV